MNSSVGHAEYSTDTREATNIRQWSSRGYLLFLFTSVYLYLFLRVLWRVGDEGTLVYGAQLVSEGALPYRDFVEVMGPGTFYWLALFFKLLGTKLIVARALLLLTGAIITALVYWMTRRLYRGSFDMLPAFFVTVISIPTWPATNHHLDSNLFALLAVGAFFLWQDTGRSTYLIGAGIISGLTSCFIQQKGLFLLAAFLVVELVNTRKDSESKSKVLARLGMLIAGYASVGAAVILFFYLAGGLYDLIYATLLWPISNYHKVNVVPYGYPFLEMFWPHWLTILKSIFPPKMSQILSVLFMIPFLVVLALPVLIAVLAVTYRLSAAKWHTIFVHVPLPYWITGLALWISEIHRPDLGHIFYGSPLLLVILFVLWNVHFRARQAVRVIGLSVVTFCLILFAMLNGIFAAHANYSMITRRGTVYSFKDDAALRFLNEQVRAGEAVFVYPYYPMYYFLADIKNPTRYSILMYHINTESQFEEVIAALERKKVGYVLWDTLVEGRNLKRWFPNYKHPSREQLHLERYLETRYRIMDVKNGFRILRRIEGY